MLWKPGGVLFPNLFIYLFYQKKEWVMVINNINNNGNNSQHLLSISHTPGTLLSGFWAEQPVNMCVVDAATSTRVIFFLSGELLPTPLSWVATPCSQRPLRKMSGGGGEPNYCISAFQGQPETEKVPRIQKLPSKAKDQTR